MGWNKRLLRFDPQFEESTLQLYRINVPADVALNLDNGDVQLLITYSSGHLQGFPIIRGGTDKPKNLFQIDFTGSV